MRFHKWLLFGTAVMALMALLVPTGTADAVSSGFEEIPLGTIANNIMIPGVDFAPNAVNPSAYTVQANAGTFASLSGHILTNLGGDCMTSLLFRFDALQSSISFLYGADRSYDPTYPDAVMYLFTGGNPTPGIGTRVFTGSFSGADPGTGMFEGFINVMVDFDFVVLFSPSGCLAIDNLNTVGVAIAGAPGPDMIPLPLHAVVGTIINPTDAMWAPEDGASTGLTLQPGMTLWVLGVDESGEYYEVALSGIILWVRVEDMGPNYDEVWNGHPLPVMIN